MADQVKNWLNRVLVGAEEAFSKEYGFPQTLIKPSDGSYEMVLRYGTDRYLGIPAGKNLLEAEVVSMQNGRQIESQLAMDMVRLRHDRLTKSGSQFKKSSQRFSVPFQEGRQVFLSIKPEVSGDFFVFAGQHYISGGETTAIAYHPASPPAEYILNQGHNECGAVAIINGMIFQGKKPDNPPEVAHRFYEKLKTLPPVSIGNGWSQAIVTDGGIAPELLFVDNIPGLSGRVVDPSEAIRLVKSNKPVMVATPYYGGHLMLVTDVDEGRHTFRAVDSLAGVIVEDDIMSSHLNTTNEMSVQKGVRLAVEIAGVSVVTLVKKIAETADERAINANRFYMIEITDPDAFLKWLR